MKTLKITPDQMRSHIARFSGRRYHKNHSTDPTIPAEAFDAVDFPMCVLLGHAAPGTHTDSLPAIAGPEGLQVVLIELAPGQKALLHVHLRSREAFMCLQGRVTFRWNDHGTDETILEPFDIIDVPIGVYRDFQNVGDAPAMLLAILTDASEDDVGDVIIAPEERARFAERFGPDILPKLTAATGLHFTDPPGQAE